MTALLLHRTSASGDLLPARFTETLRTLARMPGAPPAPHGMMRGQELRLVQQLSPDDDACAAFLLDFPAQGARAGGSARGPGATLLTWAFHALAEARKCRLVVDDADVTPDPESLREAAMAYLLDYEDDVRASRKAKNDDGASFVRWLAREEQIELEPGAEAPVVALEAATAIYEELLESDAVADVFLSERELGHLLQRFRARESAQ